MLLFAGEILRIRDLFSPASVNPCSRVGADHVADESSPDPTSERIQCHNPSSTDGWWLIVHHPTKTAVELDA